MPDGLQTDRMVFRRFTSADVDLLVELDGDPSVMQYISGGAPTPRRTIETEILPRFLCSYVPPHGYGVWAATEKATGEFLGWFSLLGSGRDVPTEARMGYRLRRAVWGKGYATEGVRALIRTGFTELGIARLLASTYQDNLASRRVMEKAGMSLVRRFRPTVEDLRASGPFHVDSAEVWVGDEVEYAVERANWTHLEGSSQV